MLDEKTPQILAGKSSDTVILDDPLQDLPIATDSKPQDDESKFLDTEEKIREGLGIKERDLADFCFRFVHLAFESFMNTNQRTLFLKSLRRKYRILLKQKPKA